MIASKSIIIIVLLGVAFAVSAEDRDLCPSKCSVNKSPVCAWNGKVYKQFVNECSLRASNCHPENADNAPYVATVMDWCQTKLVNNIRKKLGDLQFQNRECLMICPLNYAPVCVSNGQYRGNVSNKCIMESYNCMLKASKAPLLRLLRKGFC